MVNTIVGMKHLVKVLQVYLWYQFYEGVISTQTVIFSFPFKYTLALSAAAAE